MSKDIAHSADCIGSIPTEGLSALISQLETAEAGRRELDAFMFCAFNEGWRPGKGIQLGGVIKTGTMRTPEPVTTSLDAALALAERVLPGCEPGVMVEQRLPDRTIWGAWTSVKEPDDVFAKGPALALCIAILRATEASR